MSLKTPAQLRAFAFGDLDAGLWGLAAATEFGSVASFAATVSAEGSSPDESWRLEAETAELEFAPAAESATLDRFWNGAVVQLARVTGRLDSQAVDCFGVRAIGDVVDPPFESVRATTGWLDGADGFAVIARRPQGAEGHDSDELGAVVFEAGQALPVTDPRLSTVYGPDGTPVRAGVELWLEEPGEDQQDEDDPPPGQFPRRAAGEALGSSATLEAGQLALRAELFRWHLRGEEGAGVYLLAQPR